MTEDFVAAYRRNAADLAAHGLYDPAEEHDACGVGLIAALDGVFAAGDIVRGASLVVWAIRDGRDAAERIHAHIAAKATAAVAAE